VADRRLPGRVDRLVPAGEQGPRVLEEDSARGRQRDGPLRAGQELHAELLFQPADLLAERGLHDVQALGGTAEVELFGHSHEVAQMAELHDLS
jgi:hypothetical protein